MLQKKFISYYRVSTNKQNGDMPAQKTAVKQYLKAHYPPMASFTETESGGKNDRPELAKALKLCIKHDATLVVAKLDRLSRDVGFIDKLLKSKIKFVCADMPEANELTISLLSVLAQHERSMISTRTRLALAEKKREGVKLGTHNPRVKRGVVKYWQARKANKKPAPQTATISAREQADAKVLKFLKLFRKQGLTYPQITKELNEAGIQSRSGQPWHAMQIYRVCKRNRVA